MLHATLLRGAPPEIGTTSGAWSDGVAGSRVGFGRSCLIHSSIGERYEASAPKEWYIILRGCQTCQSSSNLLAPGKRSAET